MGRFPGRDVEFPEKHVHLVVPAGLPEGRFQELLTTSPHAQWRGLVTSGDLGISSTEMVPNAVSKCVKARASVESQGMLPRKYPVSSGPTQVWEQQLEVQAQELTSSVSASVYALVPGHVSIQEKCSCWTSEPLGANLMVSLPVWGPGQCR